MSLAFNPAVDEAISRTLFHFLWEGACIAAILAVTLPATRRRSARVRYAAACAALVAMAAAFAGTAVHFWPHPTRAAEGVVMVGQREAPRIVFAVSEVMPHMAEASRVRWIAPLWMLGVVLFSLRSLVAWLAALRLRRVGVNPVAPEWRERFTALPERARVSQPVMLLESYLAEIPVVIGSLKPVILIPASLLTGFPAEHLELILLHELAHIRRLDYLVNLLQSLVENVLFYHPAVWWVSSVIRAEREHCCDDAVVEAAGDGRVFAEALTALEERRWAIAEAAMAANGGQLMNRIRRLLDGPGRPVRFAAGPAFTAGLLAAGLALMVPLVQAQKAASRPLQSPPAAPAPPVLVAQAPPAAPSTPPAPPAEPPPAPAAAPARDYDRWLNEEVYWIITPYERDAFQRLTTDDQREEFIDQFWWKRNPTPDADDNPYQDEYYRRFAYANQNFTTMNGIPGWRTDRGRTYIKYGEPNEREQQPGSEKWRYRFIQGIGNDVMIEFADRAGKGEYRLLADLPEPVFFPNAVRMPADSDQFARLQDFVDREWAYYQARHKKQAPK